MSEPHFERMRRHTKRQATGRAKEALQRQWEQEHCGPAIENGRNVTKCQADPLPNASATASGQGSATQTAGSASSSNVANPDRGAAISGPGGQVNNGTPSGMLPPGSGSSSSNGSSSGSGSSSSGGSSNSSDGSDSSDGTAGDASGDGSDGSDNGDGSSSGSSSSDGSSSDGSSSDGGSSASANGNGSDGSGSSSGNGSDSGDDGTTPSLPMIQSATPSQGTFASSSVLFAVPSASGSFVYSVVPLTNSLGQTTGSSTTRLIATPSGVNIPLGQSGTSSPENRNLAATVAPAVVGGILGLIVLALAIFCGFSYRRRKQQAELDAMGFGYHSGAALAPTPSPRYKGRPYEFLSNIKSTLGIAPSMKRKAQQNEEDDEMDESGLQHRPSISPFSGGYGPGAQALAAGLAGAGSPPKGPRPMSEGESEHLRVVHMGPSPTGDHESAYESAADPTDTRSYSSWQRDASTDELASEAPTEARQRGTRWW